MVFKPGNWCREETGYSKSLRRSMIMLKKMKVPGEYDVSVTFNVSDLFCLM
jgi:hypothetical protein